MCRYDRSHTFFYCDPPYWQTAGYGVEFGLEQYQALADFMRGCQGKVMVSVNDHPAMRDVFAGLSLDTLAISYSVAAKPASRKQSGELVITNW